MFEIQYFITTKTESIPCCLNEVIKYEQELFIPKHVCRAELAASCVM